MKDIHVYTHRDFSLREIASLNLCRKILEDCYPQFKDRYIFSRDGEMITLNSAIETFDNILEKNSGK